MINNILDMAKIESGHMDINLQSINLEQLLQEICDTVKPILQQNNNQLTLQQQNEKNELHIDREKLVQIILNLLSNATKFTQNGTICLNSLLSNDLLTVRVTDSGIGLSEEHQKVIFEEFRQADGSSTRNFEGTGLGLAITKRFIELLGGKISVKSELGEGATFTIAIPLPISSSKQTKNIDQIEEPALPL